jgi:hypothetical protein
MLKLTLHLETGNMTYPTEGQHYEAELSLSTRAGNITKRAMGKKRAGKLGVGFGYQFLNKERLRVGKLADIYTRILGQDEKGRHIIQTTPTNLLQNPNDQNLVFLFAVKRIRFDADDQMLIV